MAEQFLDLTSDDRREALGVAAARLRRPAHLLEKDVWVVWTLQTLFAAPFAEHLAFKGGTSLSKAYGAIRRFSEDVDLTYDIRALAPDLAGVVGEPVPSNRSQQRKWSDEIRARLPPWIERTVMPSIERQLRAKRLPARIAQDNDKVVIEYDSVTAYGNYVRPAVLLEFGARSTGEPIESRNVVCDASSVFPGLSAFPAIGMT